MNKSHCMSKAFSFSQQIFIQVIKCDLLWYYIHLLAYHVRNLILNVIDCYYCCAYSVFVSHRAQKLEVVGNSVANSSGIRTSCVVRDKRSMKEGVGWKEWWIDTSRNEVTGSKIQREKKIRQNHLGRGGGRVWERKKEEEWEVMF